MTDDEPSFFVREPHCYYCDYRGIPNYQRAALRAVHLSYKRGGRSCLSSAAGAGDLIKSLAESTRNLITLDYRGWFVIDSDYQDDLSLDIVFDDRMHCHIDWRGSDIKRVRWIRHNKLHGPDPDCPAQRDFDGWLISEYFLNNGKFRRVRDMPNCEVYLGGLLHKEKWYTGSYGRRKLSRYTGPALVTYSGADDDLDPSICSEQFFITGTEYSKAEWMHKTGSVTK